MQTQQQDGQLADLEKQDHQERKAEIAKYVLVTLGHPDNLYNVQVRRLWKDHYRVNVLIGPDATSVTCAHSYFLVADGDGAIIASTPSITRQY